MPKLPNLLTVLTLAGFVFVSHAQTPTPMKTIELEWEAVENAAIYEVKLIPEGGGAPIFLQVPESHLSREVPIGNYVLQMRARSKDGTDYSPWSQAVALAVLAKELSPIHPSDGSVIESNGQPKQTIEFEWTPVEDVRLYNLIVWSEDRKDKPFEFTTKETHKKLEVPVAEVYHWQVRFESADDVTYQQTPKTFTFTLRGDKVTKPEIIKAISAHSPDFIAWKSTSEAQSFDVRLDFRHLDESEWTPLKSATLTSQKLDLSHLKPGVYKIEVIAKAERRMPSDPAVYEFVIKPKSEDLEILLKSAQLDSGPSSRAH